MHRQCKKVIDSSSATGTVQSTALDIVNAYGYDAALSLSYYAVATLVIASTGWDPATDIVTSASHGLETGMVYRLTTSGGLPAGLATGTDYWIIKIDADTFQLASSLANAQAGTAVDFTTAGTGNHTLTQQANVATLEIEISPDEGATWFPYDNGTPVDVSSLSEWTDHFETAADQVRLTLSVSKGAVSAGAWLCAKG